MKLRTCLNYGGNCEQAFRFYEEHLGGKITAKMTYGEQSGGNYPPEWQKPILFAQTLLRLLAGSSRRSCSRRWAL